ncbi:RNA polymerase sigma-70 factor [Pedobacter gandavensis]|uniref:RNA polymerase sigma-70 factor n=1 Tax=Pedobacter gandavensis TaxID=2679963 RepID=UPI00292CE88D|nr:RNA polymerase sigma-70 factor [Pedobacter gandavensis]
MNSYLELPDAELVGLMKLEEEGIDAYTAIYYRYRKPLVLHAQRMMGDPELAKDMVQEIFTWLFQQRKLIQINTALSSYLYRAVRNKVFDNLKHSKVKLNYAEDFYKFTRSTTALADEQVCLKELAQAIASEIEKLPPRMREVFELSRKEFLTQKEIAKKLNLSENTVNNQIQKAMKKLRENELLHAQPGLCFLMLMEVLTKN